MVSIDERDHICHACPANSRNLIQGLPERILDTDARLAAIDDNGVLAIRRFHGSAFSVMSRICRPGNMRQTRGKILPFINLTLARTRRVLV